MFFWVFIYENILKLWKNFYEKLIEIEIRQLDRYTFFNPQVAEIKQFLDIAQQIKTYKKFKEIVQKQLWSIKCKKQVKQQTICTDIETHEK